MYDVRIIQEEDKVTVLVQQVRISFVGDNAMKDANDFVIQLLKETGRIGY